MQGEKKYIEKHFIVNQLICEKVGFRLDAVLVSFSPESRGKPSTALSIVTSDKKTFRNSDSSRDVHNQNQFFH